MDHTRLTLCACLLTGVAFSARAEPLAEFELIVNRCKQAFDTRASVEVVYAEPAQSWVKRIHAPAVISYDVKKTDSLVSPLVAYLEVIEATAAERGVNEAAAASLNASLEDKAMRSTRRVNFAYRDNTWTLVDGQQWSEYKLKRGDPFSKQSGPLLLTRQDFQKASLVWRRCLTGN